MSKISYNILENMSSKNLMGLQQYACLLLNLAEQKFHLFEKYKYLWDSASLKIAVDGSANVLWKNNAINTADIVCGDFDSIDHKLMNYLRNPQSNPKTALPRLIGTPDQNETDFTKALSVAMSLEPHINNFIALYYNNGSRIDHIFGLVNTLHKKTSTKKKIYLLNVKSGIVSWLLQPGSHAIHKIPGREFCSLVPFSGPAEVTATGLEYGMNKLRLSFKGPLSICNISQNDCKTIHVETDNLVLWSIETNNKERKKT